MGYKIRVNHNELLKTANEIENYLKLMKTQMGNADKAVGVMIGSWQGEDAVAFKTKWETVQSSGSTYMKMRQSLEKYSSFLKGAASKYKKAQSDAISRANKLPKW